ncbi:hypothetical protein [Agaribacter flavus]|uniref:Lipoprotein n=1 Tax=Agaribacter flavus TaxID=1902781 RepID=A0ABV7FTA1_9ALTE
MTSAHFTFLILGIATLLLSACQSTTSRHSNTPLLVGPSEPISNTTAPSKYKKLQNAEIFLDVAVPTFSPGFPLLKNSTEIDYEELDDSGIWPQLRRTEAKLFAVETKNALEETKAFGAVRVVPNANTTADIFVLGKILNSDSEQVGMQLTVVDSTGEVLGIKSFEHEVSESYFRDQRNKDKNPYQPLFDKGRDYVLELLSKLDTETKQKIKETALLRYARYYSPEAYGSYLSTEIKKKQGQRYYKFELTGLPAEDDAMLARIEDLRAQELLFVDRLQDQYDTFYAETSDAYEQWQRETLPEIAARREAIRNRNIKAGVGVGLAILAGILASESSKDSRDADRTGSGTERAKAGAKGAGAVIAGLGSIYAVNDAFQSNSELKVQNAIIEEKGQAVDLSVSSTEMKFEDQVIELQGTATEQYLQWKQHLRKIYELEATPDVQL